jgi:RNA polymerase sigma-70 factor (ECF subfamily)
MTVESVGAARPPSDGGETILPPLEADPLFIDAVDEAVAGDSFAMSPETQPGRTFTRGQDFSSLYIRHRSSFSLHARRFLNDSRDIDEVVQETFLRLFLALPEIENELQAIAFSRRVLTNLCIDRYRSDVRRPRLVDLDELAVYDLENEEAFDDPILRAEDAAIVREALALLSPLHRAALVKREIEEKSIPVIASELGVAEDSVKHLLFRARRALRRLLVGSTVDPAADLTLGEALQLGARRAGRASVTGVKVLVVLLVGLMISVPLLRHGTASRGVIGGLAPTPILPSADGPGGLPHATALSTHPRAGHRAPRTHAPMATSTGRSPQQPSVQPPADVPVDPGPPTVIHKPKPSDGGHGGGQPWPVGSYSVSGTYAGAAVVEQQYRTSPDASSTTSVAKLSAMTAQGRLDLTQSVSLDAALTPQSVTLNLVVPVPAGQVGYLVSDPVTTATRQSDGTVLVTLAGAAAQVGSLDGESGSLDSVQATIRYDKDLVQVLAEKLVLTAAPAASPDPQSSGPQVPPVGGNAPGQNTPLSSVVPDGSATTAFPRTTE